MTQETTQIQKAIVIAKKDGFKQIGNTSWYMSNRNSKQVEHSEGFLLDQYLFNLNYLMPIAVKVNKEFDEVWVELHTKGANLNEIFATHRALRFAVLDLNLDSNNQYTELFEALFNAIKLLENE